MPSHVAEVLLSNIQPKLHKAQQELGRVKAESLAAIKQAALQYVETLPKKGTTLRTVPPPPLALARSARAPPSGSWVLKLHASHKLWAAGGLAFCQSCGTVSQGVRRTRLSIVCGSKPGKTTTRPKLIGQGQQARNMPGGSEWRIRKLLSGNLAGMDEWPDGTSKEVTIVPARVFPYPVAFPIDSNI